MKIHTGFIVECEDELDFYAIKRFIQELQNARLVYCTRNTNEHLYIKTEFELAEMGGKQ